MQPHLLIFREPTAVSRNPFHTPNTIFLKPISLFGYEKKNYDSLTAAGWHILFRELSPCSFASLIFISFAIRNCINFSLQPHNTTTDSICQHLFLLFLHFFQNFYPKLYSKTLLTPYFFNRWHSFCSFLLSVGFLWFFYSSERRFPYFNQFFMSF